MQIMKKSNLNFLMGVPDASAISADGRSYGVDVSSYLPTSTSKYSKASAQFVIVKVSEGTSYRNPNAKAQVASTKDGKLLPMAYHFANFGSSSSRAESEAGKVCCYLEEGQAGLHLRWQAEDR